MAATAEKGPALHCGVLPQHSVLLCPLELIQRLEDAHIIK